MFTTTWQTIGKEQVMLRKTLIAMCLLALSGALLPACKTTPTRQGALIGGSIGAVTGAVVGHQQGKGAEGAAIGAAAGGLAGALIGDTVDERRDSKAQQQQSQTGHYETRTVRTPSGETYEERVWVPDK